MALWSVLDILMIVLPVCAFYAKSRRSYSIITLAFIPINAIDTVISLTR
jgi:hypothetical protein